MRHGGSLLLAAAVLAQACAADVRPPAEEAMPSARELESDPEVYLQLIARLQDKRLYFASLAHLDVFDRRWPGHRRATLLRADALREVGQLDQAAALYRGLLSGELAAGAQHGLGLLASRRGDLGTAEAALQEANRLAPTDAEVLNDLGYVQLLLRRLDQAGFNLHKATELDPKNLRAGANLALYYLLDRRPARAEATMDWYKLSDGQRKEVFEKAGELAGDSAVK